MVAPVADSTTNADSVLVRVTVPNGDANSDVTINGLATTFVSGEYQVVVPLTV